MGDTAKPNRLRKRERKNTRTFTDKFIKSLKPEAEMYQIRESRGFAIRVLPSGVKTWYYIYKFAGKRKQLNLGNYPDVSLEKAHDEYSKAVGRLKEGEDPAKPPPPPKPEPEALTVEKLASLWIDWSEQNHSPKWANTLKLALNKDILPQYGHRLAEEIRRSDALQILEAKAASAPGQARNLHKALRGMWQYGVEYELVEYNPFAEIRAVKRIPAMKQKNRERVLLDVEIIHIWEKIDAGGGSDSTRRALKVMLLSGQRNGEVAGMHRSEIQIGVGKPRCEQCRRCGWWTIPEERRQGNKGGTHRVYLSPLALEIIGDRHGYIFPGDTPEKPITSNAVNYHVRREVEATGKLPFYGLTRWTPHDLRRTCGTGVRKLGASRDTMDLILGHKTGGVTGVYDLYEGDPEKEKWLTEWGMYISSLISAA